MSTAAAVAAAAAAATASARKSRPQRSIRLEPQTCTAATGSGRNPPAATPVLLRWGAGGSYLVGALIYLLSTANLWLTDPELLYVEDDGRKPARKKQVGEW